MELGGSHQGAGAPSMRSKGAGALKETGAGAPLCVEDGKGGQKLWSYQGATIEQALLGAHNTRSGSSFILRSGRSHLLGSHFCWQKLWSDLGATKELPLQRLILLGAGAPVLQGAGAPCYFRDIFMLNADFSLVFVGI